MKPKW